MAVPSVFAESIQLKVGKMFAQGRVREIQDLLSQRLKKDPSQFDLWLEMAGLHKSQGNYAGAVQDYKNYLTRNNDWKIRAQMALALEQLGHLTEAEPLLLKLDHDHSNQPDILWGLARLRLFQSKWKKIQGPLQPQEALKQAKKYLLSLINIKPQYALYSWELGEVCRSLGDDDRALKAYEKVVQQDASFKLAYRYIAKILAKKGRYRESIVKYEQAMNIEPDDDQLKKEAKAVSLQAPGEAQKRQDERLRLWAQWKAPEEKPIAPSVVTIRVGLGGVLPKLRFRCDSSMQLATAHGEPLTVLKPGQDYQVVYKPAKPRQKRPESWVLRDSRDVKVLAFDQKIWITSTDPQKPLLLHAVPSNTGYFMAREEDRAYRGFLEIAPRTGEGFQVINHVGLEDYCAGVLPAEMSPKWPLEALKTQAILVRSYVLYKRGGHNAEGFDVVDSVKDQVYRGLRGEEEKPSEAVRQTAGLVLKHRGKIMPAVFSAECGGHTQDYAEAWGYKLPVVGVEDYDPRFNQDMEFPLSPDRLERWVREDRVAWCRTWGLHGYQNYRWAALVSAKDLAKRVGPLGKVRRILVTHRSTAGWADHLLVEGENGTKEYKGDVIRRILGGLRSNLIWIEPQLDLKGWPVDFLIYGGGWGHGVGMCQVGTYGLARGGKNFEEILKHYFPKGDVKKY